MSRVQQPPGNKGSLKWIQRCVNEFPDVLNDELRPHLGAGERIAWLSPLASDDYAEYRDGEFLDLIGCGHLREQLAAFWPRRGPQWDALGRTDSGKVLLVEAKAHIDEMCSSACAATGAARTRIEIALADTAMHLAATPRAPWIDVFYQLANRMAYLHFLRSHGVDAWLVLVNFVGDDESGGPRTAAEWHAAYRVAEHVMGIPKRNPLARHILHTHPSVARLEL